MRLMFLAPLAGVVASFLSGINLTSTEGAIHSDNNNEDTSLRNIYTQY